MDAAGRPHFGALLRQFRLDAGMTQQELAERAKLSVEAISTLERGARTRPHRDTVVLLGRALDLSPEREVLLGSAIGIAHPSRQRERSDALNASLLRLVRPDAQETPRHNLPQQLTSFVGRQREIDEIAALLQRTPTGDDGRSRRSRQDARCGATREGLDRRLSGRCVAGRPSSTCRSNARGERGLERPASSFRHRIRLRRASLRTSRPVGSC